MTRGQKTWGKNAGNRTNNRDGKINGKSYSLSGLKWCKYSLELGGTGIYTYTAIHNAIAEGKDIYQFEKEINEWSKLNRETGRFDKIII